MHPLLAARTKGYLRDCAGYLGLAAALVPVGLVLNHTVPFSRAGTVAVSAVLPLAATVIAAVRESHQGTPGHRRVALTVLDPRGRVPGLGRAVLRNTVKIGVPWQLGHLVAVGAAYGGFERRDPWTLVPTALVYAWVVAAAMTVAAGSGWALHDRVAGTQVRPTQVAGVRS